MLSVSLNKIFPSFLCLFICFFNTHFIRSENSTLIKKLITKKPSGDIKGIDLRPTCTGQALTPLSYSSTHSVPHTPQMTFVLLSVYKHIYISASNRHFSFQPVFYDWCNKDHGMWYPFCGMVHIKEPLLLIRKSSLCAGSRFPLLLSDWSFSIYLTPYNRKQNMLNASLN